jgi:hypothetical protein
VPAKELSDPRNGSVWPASSSIAEIMDNKCVPVLGVEADMGRGLELERVQGAPDVKKATSA